MVKVLKQLEASTDPVEQALLRALRKWQDEKALLGKKRTLGREPGQIAMYGAIAVIESRILRGSVGFGEVGPDNSYEAIAIAYPNRFREDVVQTARQRIAKAKLMAVD
jgi:hypothetical protein